MRRLSRLLPKSVLPRSVLGQMLLAVGAALLVAQTISALLQYRAELQQEEVTAANRLAFQLEAEPRVGFRRGDRQRRDTAPRWARLGVQRTSDNPLRPGERRYAAREALLTQVLAERGIHPAELVVTSRHLSEDPFLLAREEERGRNQADRGARGDEHFLVAAMRRADDPTWSVARAGAPDYEAREFGWLIGQTLLLYIVLVGGLAILLRRMTRPLAALTARVETFAETRDLAGQLAPSGPEDMHRLIVAHNAMEARIVALVDEKDVMLGAIGHDLKTPLTALRVRIESVEDDVERGRMAATIEDIVRSLDDILSLARVGRPSEPPERTDLSALLAAVVEDYEDMGQPVTLEPAPRLAMKLRASWLRRALRNLIDNGLRYGDTVRVALESDDGRAVIRIEDDGPGIPDEAIAAMLEPFARGDASRNRGTGGAGLGLTLARAIAEQDGGSLHLANRHGPDRAVLGLVARLHLPIR